MASILSAVTEELSKDSSRRFIWAEISFFARWFETLSSAQRARFTALVRSGQLEFVGGGWVQNDEANPTPDAVVNQVTEGHEYLLTRFGVRPRVGWQIDPFGHSGATPALFSLMGYDALVINRIHYDLKTRFKGDRDMEFMWRGSDVGLPAPGGELFTHVLHTHYSAPQGFDWENSGVVRISSDNVRYQAEALVSMLEGRAAAYRTRHLLVPFGDDFKFKFASTQFSNMDQLINYINTHSADFGGAHIRYSTPSEYFAAAAADAAARSLTVMRWTGDFFPYADNGDSYWTGYFTTRPTLKVVWCARTRACV